MVVRRNRKGKEGIGWEQTERRLDIVQERKHEAEEQEWQPPRRKSEKVAAHPQEPEQEESPLQPEESGMTYRSEETMPAAKVRRCPASDPSLRRTTTRKLPSVHSSTALSRLTQPGP